MEALHGLKVTLVANQYQHILVIVYLGLGDDHFLREEASHVRMEHSHDSVTPCINAVSDFTTLYLKVLQFCYPLPKHCTYTDVALGFTM